MINNVLQEFQNGGYSEITTEMIKDILDKTIKLLELFKESKNKDYLVDACISLAISDWEKLKENIHKILNSEQIATTFIKSPATTTNVNKRFECVVEIIKG